MPAPELLPIKYMEDLHTAWVGRWREGQFFIAETLPVAIPSAIEPTGTDEWVYVVNYLFRDTGELREARHAKVPYSSNEGYHGLTEQITRQFLDELGDYTLGDILVKPFAMHIDGIEFGLVYNEETELINLQPGSIISFFEPWDGEYDT